MPVLPRLVCFLCVSLFIFSASLKAQVPVTIAPDWNAPAVEIPPDFSGLSYETIRVLPEGGKYYFTAENTSLIAMFRMLGVRSLRIGGNSVDKPEVKIPDGQDIDQLFAFAREADVKVIYALRLRNQTGPEKSATPVAKYIMDNYKGLIDCFGIGNEATYYHQPGADYPYSSYVDLFDKYVAGITAADVAPEAMFAGPSGSGSRPDWRIWSAELANDEANDSHLKFISQHWYVAGSSRQVTDAATGREHLLSPVMIKTYEEFAAKFVPVVQKDKLRFRMEETNTYSNAGAKGVSDTFTSALWGLDYLYWWASQGAAGVNFHTGDRVAAGPDQVPCNYALFWSSPAGYSVHPLGYAYKAFTLAAQGRLIPMKTNAESDGNFRVYGVVAGNNDLYVTVINKEHGGSGRDAAVSLNPGRAYGHGEVMFLTCDTRDIDAKTGVTLGGAAIKDDATWDGQWTALPAPTEGKEFSVTVPATSAAIIRLQQ